MNDKADKKESKTADDKVEIQMGHIHAARDAWPKLLALRTSVKTKLKLQSYFNGCFLPAFKLLEEKRMELLKKYGTPNKKGAGFDFATEAKKRAFTQQFNQFCSESTGLVTLEMSQLELADEVDAYSLKDENTGNMANGVTDEFFLTEIFFKPDEPTKH